MVLDAVERNFEIIGEAVKHVPDEIRKQYKHIPFKLIAGMRDKLAHDYFGTDYEIIWKSIQDDLPKVARDIEELIKELS